MNSAFVGTIGVIVTPVVFLAVILKVTGVNSVGGINGINNGTFVCFRIIAALTLVVNLVIIGIVGPNTNLGFGRLRGKSISRCATGNKRNVG